MRKIFLKNNRKSLLISIAAIAIVNFALFSLVAPPQVTFEDGAIGIFISFPICCVIIALLCAIIPYSKSNYKFRFIEVTYFLLFITQLILLSGIILLMLFHLLGLKRL